MSPIINVKAIIRWTFLNFVQELKNCKAIILQELPFNPNGNIAVNLNDS